MSILGALRAFQNWSGSLADKLERPSALADEPVARGSKKKVEDFTDERQVKNLVRALRHRRVAVRVEAAEQIGRRGIVGAKDALLSATADKRREVRRAALGALWLLDAALFAQTAVKMSRASSRAEVLADLDAIVEAAVARSHLAARR